MATIWKRHTKTGDPRWGVMVYVRDPGTGKRQCLSATFRREKDAKAWGRKQDKRKDDGDHPTTDRRTLAEYMQWWLTKKATGATRDRRSKRNAPRSRTLADYRKAVEKWITHPPRALAWFGSKRLDRVTADTLDKFYAAMLEASTAVGTVKRLHGVLGQAFVEAVRKGALARNPADWASVPQVDFRDPGDRQHYEAEGIKAMDEAQAARFLKAARGVDGEGCFSALWHLLLQTGLRPGEAFALKWEDVDELATIVQVRRNLVRLCGVKGWSLERPKTKNAVRIVPLPALTMRELQAWRTRQKWQRRIAGEAWQEYGFVFTTEKGTPLHGARRSFERVTAGAELGEWGPEPQREHVTGPLPTRLFAPAFRIYDLRHTCVTLWLKAGVPIHVASKLAGHATAAFTLTRYAHALPDQKLEAAEKMDRMFGSG